MSQLNKIAVSHGTHPDSRPLASHSLHPGRIMYSSLVLGSSDSCGFAACLCSHSLAVCSCLFHQVSILNPFFHVCTSSVCLCVLYEGVGKRKVCCWKGNWKQLIHINQWSWGADLVALQISLSMCVCMWVAGSYWPWALLDLLWHVYIWWTVIWEYTRRLGDFKEPASICLSVKKDFG